MNLALLLLTLSIPVVFVLYAIWLLLAPAPGPNWNNKVGGQTKDGKIVWTNVGPIRNECECEDCMEPGLRGPFYPESTI